MQGISSLIILLLFFAVMYFVLIRPQQKRQREHAKMVADLTLDDDIVTIGGIHGTVVALDDETVDIEVTDDVVIRIQRSSIAKIVAPVAAVDAPDDADDESAAEQ